MQRIYLVAVPLLAISLCPASAFGQSLLKKLEEKLKTAEPAEPAAGADAAPARPSEPATASDAELPAPAPGTTPALKRGFLGIKGDDAEEGGVVVVLVNPGSPAEAAGLRVGDVIKRINETNIANKADMTNMLEGAPGGAKFKLSVLRDGRTELLDLTLGRPFVELGPRGPADSSVTARTSADEPENAAADAATTQHASLGITVIPLTDETRARYGVTTRSGAVIAAVRPGGPAAQAELPVGAVVVAIDGERIDNKDQLVEAIRAAKPGDEVELSYYVGARLSRQSIKLGAAEPGVGPGSGYGRLGDRPIIDRVERALGGLARPGTRPDGGPGVLPDATGDVQVLREQIEKLAKRVEELEQLVARLEARLPAENPPAADDAVTPPPPGERPRIRLDDGPAIPPATPPAAERPRTLLPPTRPPAGGKSDET